MSNVLVSIIVPVYNVEKYLNRCIESLVKQTYSEIEIILIDDGSTDTSGKLCDEWCQKDSRIKVVHKENAGLGMARNSGIEVAGGSFITFIDSDDYVAPYTIEKSLIAAIGKKADMVCYGMTKVSSNGVAEKRKPPMEIDFSGASITEQFLPDLVAEDKVTGYSLGLSMNGTTFLVRKSRIDQINWRFMSEREIISEDYYSLLYLYKNIRKVVVLPEIFYFYCENQQSLTRVYRKDRFEMNKVFYIKSLEAIEKLGYSQELKKRFAYPFINNSIASLKQLVKSNDKFIEKFKNLSEIINDSVFQSALSVLDIRKDSVQRKLFITWLKNKKLIGCYVLLKLK